MIVLHVLAIIIGVLIIYNYGKTKGYTNGLKKGKREIRKGIKTIDFERLNNGDYFTFIHDNHSYVIFNTMQLEISLQEHGVSIEFLGNKS